MIESAVNGLEESTPVLFALSINQPGAGRIELPVHLRVIGGQQAELIENHKYCLQALKP
jgi:hypothetical protein